MEMIAVFHPEKARVNAVLFWPQMGTGFCRKERKAHKEKRMNRMDTEAERQLRPTLEIFNLSRMQIKTVIFWPQMDTAEAQMGMGFCRRERKAHKEKRMNRMDAEAERQLRPTLEIFNPSRMQIKIVNFWPQMDTDETQMGMGFLPQRTQSTQGQSDEPDGCPGGAAAPPYLGG